MAFLEKRGGTGAGIRFYFPCEIFQIKNCRPLICGLQKNAKFPQISHKISLRKTRPRASAAAQRQVLEVIFGDWDRWGGERIEHQRRRELTPKVAPRRVGF